MRSTDLSAYGFGRWFAFSRNTELALVMGLGLLRSSRLQMALPTIASAKRLPRQSKCRPPLYLLYLRCSAAIPHLAESLSLGAIPRIVRLGALLGVSASHAKFSLRAHSKGFSGASELER